MRAREIGAWPEAAGWHRAPGRSCPWGRAEIPGGAGASGLAHPEQQGGLGEERGSGRVAFSSLPWGRDRPPYAAGFFPGLLLVGACQEPAQRPVPAAPSPVFAEVSLLAVSAWKQ